MTQVIVRDRREGKTTELIKWLLQGKEQTTYPYWDRVIVSVSSAKMVATTTEMILTYIKETNWNPCEQMLAHVDCETQHQGILTDVRKAVWSMSDYYLNERGNRGFEFAVDDIDLAWERGYRFLRQPALITLTGKLYDAVRD